MDRLRARCACSGRSRTPGNQRMRVNEPPCCLPIRALAAERLGFHCAMPAPNVPRAAIRPRRNAMTDRTQSLATDRRGERRLIRAGLLIAAALMLSLVFISTSARAAESDPTIVLV